MEKDRRRGEEKKIEECRPGVFGKNSHFCGIPARRQTMNGPAGSVSGETTSRENTCKGHCSRGQKTGISAEDEKTKGHSTP